jgi:hypothetical protein
MKMITEEEYMKLLEVLRTSFTSLEKKIEVRFDTVDQRLDWIEQRLDYHETWLKRIDNNIEHNVVQKKDFYTLIKVLEKGNILSLSEAGHLLTSDR